MAEILSALQIWRFCGDAGYGTFSFAGSERALSFPRKSTAETQYVYCLPLVTAASLYAGVFTSSALSLEPGTSESLRYTLYPARSALAIGAQITSMNGCCPGPE